MAARESQSAFEDDRRLKKQAIGNRTQRLCELARPLLLNRDILSRLANILINLYEISLYAT
jgi:hypothetical protein